MRHIQFLTSFLCIAFAIFACSSDNETDPNGGELPGNGEVVATGFAKGADISWVTEMEADGKKFYNADGVETDCFRLMKELGMTAIRLRVWVNPETNYCNYSNKADVLVKAKRAKAEGMDVMIDFHYSDWFADPGRQDTPQAWEGKTLSELKEAVAAHTKDVLQALKEAGVTPKWVQVGNESRVGMMWPTGRLWDENGDLKEGWDNYVALSNAGYDAVKSVFSDAIVVIHIDNAWDDQDWWFKKFKAKGGKMDMIGLSHYPQTKEDKSWSEMNALALEHIKTWGETYGCKVMVCEVGVKQGDEALAATVLKAFVKGAKEVEQCAGVFYWEPQVYGGWKPAVYTTLGWGAYDMGAFTKSGKPAAAMDAFK